jgi:hypothetical protein
VFFRSLLGRSLSLNILYIISQSLAIVNKVLRKCRSVFCIRQRLQTRSRLLPPEAYAQWYVG